MSVIGRRASFFVLPRLLQLGCGVSLTVYGTMSPDSSIDSGRLVSGVRLDAMSLAVSSSNQLSCVGATASTCGQERDDHCEHERGADEQWHAHIDRLVEIQVAAAQGLVRDQELRLVLVRKARHG